MLGGNAQDLIMQPLVEDGYQVIEYRWMDNAGWMTSKSNQGNPLDDSKWLGLSAASCRVDRLIRGLKSHFHPAGPPDQPFCGVGQSGGAVQLAYTVAHHGADDTWDSLVLTGGPTIVDEVFGCSEDPPSDQAQSDEEA